MKYFFRLLAVMPALCVGIQTVLLFVIAMDYHWCILPCFFSLLATIILLDNVDNIADSLKSIAKNMAALW